MGTDTPAATELLITQCPDTQRWYADMVGQRVPLLREIDEGWLSREPAGYTNVVLRADARVVTQRRGR